MRYQRLSKSEGNSPTADLFINKSEMAPPMIFFKAELQANSFLHSGNTYIENGLIL